MPLHQSDGMGKNGFKSQLRRHNQRYMIKYFTLKISQYFWNNFKTDNMKDFVKFLSFYY